MLHKSRIVATLATLLALVLVMTARFEADAAVPSNPFSGARLFVDPGSNARKTADAWRSSRPADSVLLEKIAQGSQADWFGDWNSDIERDVRSRAQQVRNAGALPVFVTYNIPQRDLGWYSAGGAGSPEAYRQWIRSFARGLGNGPAAVVLEPDALGHMDQMSPQARNVRLALLRDAVEVLSAAGAAVYLDGGNADWMSVATAADRLKKAGVDKARGFALNVSNFVPSKETIIYGRMVSQSLGGKPFVVDTSRSGQGVDPGGEIINPPGRGLGERPTGSTGDGLVDAFLWLKRPGESDGDRAGAPPAGSWYAEYALELCRNAIF